MELYLNGDKKKPGLHKPILSAVSKSSKLQAKSKQKSAKICYQLTDFSNRRSHCIEARFCLSLLGEFQKLADKVGVCKSGFNCN